MAFTKAAFSSTSNMGSETSETRLRCSTGERMPRGHALLQHLKALGVVAHAVDVRADEGEVGLPGAGSVATFSANAIMTPYMSLSRSQRETCTTSGVAGSSGPPSRTILAWRVTVPVEPPFGKIAGPVSFGGVTRPTALRIDTTVW